MSRHLLRAADDLDLLAGSVIDKTVIRIEVPPMPEVAPVAPAPVAAPQPVPGASSQVMPGYDDPADYDAQIDAVVAKVLSAFRQSATAEEWEALLRSEPSVPRDLDRALLVDLSDALDMYDLTDPIRYRLRERFWLQCG